jgi:hypothetical protein
MGRGACLVAVVILLAGCAEARRPAVPEPASELSEGRVVAPLSAILDLAIEDHERLADAREGRPADAALAAARLEWLAGETRDGRRLAGLPSSHRFALARAVEESRAALAVAPDVTPEQAVEGLLVAARALARNDAAAVSAALQPPVFLPARPSPLDRLNQPGPRPSARLALPVLREAVARRQSVERAGLDASAGGDPMGVLIWGALAGPGR